MSIRCLLWDFGDTLCDELSLWRKSEEWMTIYRCFGESDGLSERWSQGDIGLAEVVVEVGTRFNMDPQDLHSHLRRSDVFIPTPIRFPSFNRSRYPKRS